MSRAVMAGELYGKGCSCSQAVLAAFPDAYGIDGQTALRLAASFGGGAKSGELCGCVSGALMVIGLKYGASGPADKDARRVVDEKTREFVRLFRERNGNLVCRELLRMGAKADPEAAPEEKKALKTTRCGALIAGTAELLESLHY